MDLQALSPCIPIAAGCVAIAVPFVARFPAPGPPPGWLRSEGIVFQVGFKESSASTRMDSVVYDKITVRFLTAKQEWITEDLETDGMVLYTGQFKVKQRVDVVYNPENPVEFTIVTNQSPAQQKLIWVLAGVALIGVGIYMLVTAGK